MVASVSRGLEVHPVFRRRSNPLVSHWRSEEEINSWISRRIQSAADGLPITGLRMAFGYFELSEYERQDIMRPAFLVAVDVRDPSDRQTLWTSVVVEAATEASNYSIGAGLGDWAI
jgi:hypothetical protein